MAKSSIIINRVFIISGIFNIFATLLFNQGFTNDYLASLDPNWSYFSQVIFLYWGVVHLSLANSYKNNKWIVLVCGLEKLTSYAINWTLWMRREGGVANLKEIFEVSPLTAISMATYRTAQMITPLPFSSLGLPSSEVTAAQLLEKTIASKTKK